MFRTKVILRNNDISPALAASTEAGSFLSSTCQWVGNLYIYIWYINMSSMSLWRPLWRSTIRWWPFSGKAEGPKVAPVLNGSAFLGRRLQQLPHYWQSHGAESNMIPVWENNLGDARFCWHDPTVQVCLLVAGSHAMPEGLADILSNTPSSDCMSDQMHLTRSSADICSGNSTEDDKICKGRRPWSELKLGTCSTTRVTLRLSENLFSSHFSYSLCGDSFLLACCWLFGKCISQSRTETEKASRLEVDD